MYAGLSVGLLADDLTHDLDGDPGGGARRGSPSTDNGHYAAGELGYWNEVG